MAGNLYIISTPIGNLGDISFRALDVLKSVDYIACEDTRITRRLLNHYQIKSRLVTYNDINESKVAISLIEKLNNNENIGLVSDAGTPGISDPGYRLVNACHMKDINVFSIPGASSVVSSLSISGLPTDSFYFCGFLPKKKGRQTKFNYLLGMKGTIVIFESPFRVLKTLNDIYDYMGNKNMKFAHVWNIDKQGTLHMWESLCIGKNIAKCQSELENLLRGNISDSDSKLEVYYINAPKFKNGVKTII